MLRFAIAASIAATFSTASPPIDGNDDLEVTISSQQELLAEIRNAIVDLLAHRDQLRTSPALLQEEIRSIRRRFPRANIASASTPDDLVSSLRNYQQLERGELITRLRGQQTRLYAQRCDAARSAISNSESVLNSDGFLQLPLSERIAIREALQNLLNDANVYHACDPVPPEAILDSNMSMEPNNPN